MKWNVYSHFGPPSVVLGLSFGDKIDLGSKRDVQDLNEQEIAQNVQSFYDEYKRQLNSLVKNYKYLLSALSMAGYSFTVTGLQYFFTDYLFTAINLP